MSRHTKAQQAMYDYLAGSLGAEERSSLVRHVASCSDCAEALRRMQSAFALVQKPPRPASEARTEEFWNTFADAVDRRIDERHEQKSRLTEAWDVVHSWFFFRRGSFAIAGAAVAAGVVAVVLLTRPEPARDVLVVNSGQKHSVAVEPHQQTTRDTVEEQLSPLISSPSAAEAPMRVQYANNSMSQYLRKSKILLIGITNLKTDGDKPVDLRVERQASRQLIRQARYLKQQPLDPRAGRLVDDLTRILIELANMAEHNQAPNVEIVRGGIHQENLLFKIRMAEAAYDSVRFVQTKGIRK